MACGGPAAPAGPTDQPQVARRAPRPAVPTAPRAGASFGGVRIQLEMGGGPHEGTHDLTHSNPCHKGRLSAGGWALTTTFPGAASGPTIVDLTLLEGGSFVDAWFGNVQFRAPDVEFNVDDRGATATLTATGEATGPQGEGPSFPVEITVECDRVAELGREQAVLGR